MSGVGGTHGMDSDSPADSAQTLEEMSRSVNAADASVADGAEDAFDASSPISPGGDAALGDAGVAAGVKGIPPPNTSAPPNDLIELLYQELLRVDPQTGGARGKAELMSEPVADWITQRFIKWAGKGLQTLEESEYWSGRVEL